MPTWRITYPPHAHPGALLLEDVDADELRVDSHGRQILVRWLCVILEPHEIVVRRLPAHVTAERVGSGLGGRPAGR
jgi:hypothetical protein